MSTPLLTTKLYIPPARAEWLRRPRLVGRMDEGLHRTLTLLSAPAGFGKTTLLSDWVRQSSSSIAWLSLDKDDNAPGRFWTYFIAALKPSIPRSANPLWQRSNRPNHRPSNRC